MKDRTITKIKLRLHLNRRKSLEERVIINKIQKFEGLPEISFVFFVGVSDAKPGTLKPLKFQFLNRKPTFGCFFPKNQFTKGALKTRDVYKD